MLNGEKLGGNRMAIVCGSSAVRDKIIRCFAQQA